ncbi:bifunctional homocysteine S-methyltransferase/methylenetetrahydrofolate reductase [candidate division KSB1 bacterium]|nr:bifunctional homocysteine S-methyltransferase/methylenetetrahydrofolate reductase [candidate division KSB1 bacterium]
MPNPALLTKRIEVQVVKEPFLDRLEHSILVCDGAMGTMLYASGVYINRCFDEMNLSEPNKVLDVHKKYVAARADILETNTFGANEFKLKAHGLEQSLFDINKRGAELAREACEDRLYVAGSIGPLGLQIEPLGKLSLHTAQDAFTNQAKGLLAGGVDLFILETFLDRNEIITAIKAIRSLSPEIPIIAQMTFSDQGRTPLGADPDIVARDLIHAGAHVVGANCSVGPRPMLDVIEKYHRHGARFISAQPNAGNPRLVEGRYIYMSTPEYHAEFARRFITAGANIVGGCCGTTDTHIRAIVNAVRAMQPRKPTVTVTEKPKSAPEVQPVPRDLKSALAGRIGRRFVVSVEVVAPRGINPNTVVEGIKKLVGFGVDAINIPDGPRASSRMSHLALAQIIEKSLPVETIIHYCCRDRNVLGMQSDLLGAWALGLRNILAITGDPPKLGDYPDATAVFDVDAIGLTRIIRGLNEGYDIAGNPIGMPTAWHIGVGANPGAVDLELEIDRLYQKAEAGAEYILTQPVFDVKDLTRFLDRTRDLDLPILAGIMPLMSYRTVEFLNNEVPGVTVPVSVARQMEKASDKTEAQKIGIRVAQQAIIDSKSLSRIKGIYLMPPFSKDKYDLAIEVLNVLL